jgi:hypothetical protein
VVAASSKTIKKAGLLENSPFLFFFVVVNIYKEIILQ